MSREVTWIRKLVLSSIKGSVVKVFVLFSLLTAPLAKALMPYLFLFNMYLYAGPYAYCIANLIIFGFSLDYSMKGVIVHCTLEPVGLKNIISWLQSVHSIVYNLVNSTVWTVASLLFILCMDNYLNSGLCAPVWTLQNTIGGLLNCTGPRGAGNNSDQKNLLMKWSIRMPRRNASLLIILFLLVYAQNI
jgi:hypothetical protein